ncbi:GntR family transcriptional regulator [Kineococcus radiotolerans]|uniref:GntR family transcriptional regulator n=1 Tax=Kineococcus radiotolerans TaxID=131568 RepID=A0A7W4TQN7_KINRA|nr:GntR family transcriptional regulator [Kineococcus radiotolerans]MBB2903350.1 GntR family transcriptional regulator [Kineococcus radiotolerans]
MIYDVAHQAITRLAADLSARGQVKFPPERELALRLGASRATVRKVLDDFEARGVVHRVQGRAGGAFLSGVDPTPRGPERVGSPGQGRKVQRNLNEVSGVPQMLISQGYSAGTRVIAATLEHPSAQVGDALRLSVDDVVASILRVRFADGDSLSLERMYVSALRFPALIENSLSGSMYELFAQRYGVVVEGVQESIEAAIAPADVAALLGLQTGDPLLRLTRIATDADGDPFEFSVDLFRADRTRLTVSTRTPGGRVRSAATTTTKTATAAMTTTTTTTATQPFTHP